MKQEVTNFARFYALFNKIPYVGDREELKKSVVLQYTWNRTEHLREMTEREYNDCCAGMEKMVQPAERNGWMGSKAYYELKRWRSVCLNLMQKLGIDTTDWNRVNAFCRDGRIAGKEFRKLDMAELEQLSRKLRSIERKGGIRQYEESEPTATVVSFNQ